MGRISENQIDERSALIVGVVIAENADEDSADD